MTQLQPLDIFAIWNRSQGTRLFLALQRGLAGKRIMAAPIDDESQDTRDGITVAATDWSDARIPPRDFVARAPQEITTEQETMVLGRIGGGASERIMAHFTNA